MESKNQLCNFIDILNYRAADEAENVAFSFLDDRCDIVKQLSNQQLLRRAKSIASKLQEEVSSHDRVLLFFPQGLEFVCAFFGVLYSGAVPVIVDTSWANDVNSSSLNKFQEIVRQANPAIVLTTQAILGNAKQMFSQISGFSKLVFVAVDSIDNKKDSHWTVPVINNNDLAYLQCTSGETGRPKLVMTSHGVLHQLHECIKTTYKLTESSRSVSWLPHYHYLGLALSILQPLYSGYPSYLFSHYDFIKNPFSWLYAISRYKATISGGPNFAYHMCIEEISNEQRKLLNLSAWNTAFISAEKIQKDIVEKFCHQFSPHGLRDTAMVSIYGLTELAFVASRQCMSQAPNQLAFNNDGLFSNKAKQTDGDGRDITISVASCGFSVQGVEIVVVDSNASVICDEQQLGEIWVKSKNCAIGYWNQPEDTEKIFNAYLAGSQQGPYLRTGDCAFIEAGEVYIVGKLGENQRLVIQKRSSHFNQIENKDKRTHASSSTDSIAIIGMAALFPQSDNYEEFWQNLKQEKSLITEIPIDRWDWKAIYGTSNNNEHKTNIKWGGFVNNIAEFDASFFNVSPKEAQLMDPMQRKLVQVVWQAIEDSGYKMSDLSGQKIGVFIGIGTFDYLQLMAENQQFLHAYASTGIVHCMASNRISYMFDFTGPSESMDTACSSSLVALNRAVLSIQNNECDLAIVGGANALLSSSVYVALSNAGMLSEDGKCRTFDTAANGYVRGEGIGAVVLKPLEFAMDCADNIYGVVKGAAENHGGHTSSLTAPNPFAQSDVIVTAMTKAGFTPDSMSYIEAHGTATQLGDPIEINGLKDAFESLAKSNKQSLSEQAYCAIGSVKTNIGHLEAAAGIAGIIKVLLAMKYQTIPAHLHFKKLNSNIVTEGSPFYIANKTKPWKQPIDSNGNTLPRRAGISSFGFGGVNAHVVLEEFQYGPREYDKKLKIPGLFILSAKTADRLLVYAKIYLEYFEKHQNSIDLYSAFYTLQVGREVFDARLAINADNIADLIEKLNQYVKSQSSEKDCQENGVFYGFLNNEIASVVFSLHDQSTNDIIEKFVSDLDLYHLSQLWVLGANISWEKIYQKNVGVFRVPLPSYPFEKTNHWISVRPSTTNSVSELVNNQVESLQSQFDLEWVEVPKQHDNTTNINTDKKENILDNPVQFILFCDKEGVSNKFSEQLHKRSITYHEIHQGKEYYVSDDNKHKIDPNNRSHYESILQRISDETNNAKIYIVNFWPIERADENNCSTSVIDEATYFTCNSALNLMQSLNLNGESKVKYYLWFVCSNVQTVGDNEVNLKCAALWGLAKTMLLEYREEFRSIIDIGGVGRFNPAKLLTEILQYDDEGEIVFRDDKRYVPRLIPSNIIVTKDLVVGKGGTYLITGGLGSLGLLAAKWLSSHRAKKVLLLSRRGLNRDSTDLNTQWKLEVIEQIEANGTEVDLLTADVTNKEQLNNALKKYMTSAELQGIFHAAGAYEDNLISNMEYKYFKVVTEAKISGTWNLYEITRNYHLDCFVLYSSGASTWGAATGAHYSAANYFLDAFCHYCDAKKFPVISINWGGLWKDSGIIPKDKETYFKSIGVGETSQQDGMSIMESVLRSDDKQKVIAPIDWRTFLPIMNIKRKNMLFDFIDAGLDTDQLDSGLGAEFKEKLMTLEIDNKKTTVQNKLLEILKEILGMQTSDSIVTTKGFYDLGLDSLTSIDLKTKIKNRMGAEISTTSLFDYNTIELLTQYMLKEYYSDSTYNTVEQLEEVITQDNQSNEGEIEELRRLDKDDLLEILKTELKAALGA